MSWAFEILNREVGKFMYSPEGCLPLNLEWNDRYGPSQARVFCPCDGMTLQDWSICLGQDIRVYDPEGRLAWWGYLESVDQMRGNQVFSLGLDAIANRVAVRYLLPTDSEPFVFQQTQWKDDPESQEVYGIKEQLLQRQFMHSQVADLLAADWLVVHSQPKVALKGKLTGRLQSEGYVLHCRSWMETLSWRYWQGWNGIVEHRPAQLGTQPVGQSNTNLRLAQSFVVSSPIQAFSASFRVRREGMPADNLKVSIQTDLGNQPSGLVLTNTTVSPSELSVETYRWVEVNLPGNAELEVGERYWLVVERSGSVNNGNYFWLGLDENAGFEDGTLLLQNSTGWSSRSPRADLLFQVVGRRDHRQQIIDLVENGGQFLNGVDISFMHESMLPLFYGQGRTCLQTLFDLIEQGNVGVQPLCSMVSPSRRIEIWQRPKSKEAQFYLDEDESIKDRFGQLLKAFWHAVGQWLHTSQGQPVYIHGLSFDFTNGRCLLNNNQAANHGHNLGKNSICTAASIDQKLL